MIILRWLGNAGFEFKIGKQILLVDPFITRSAWKKMYFVRAAPDKDAIHEHIRACDHILISHAHFDHFMDVPEIARWSGAVIHGSNNTCELARVLGVPEAQRNHIHTHDHFSLGDIEIQVTPAAHPWIPGYTTGRLNGRIHSPLRLREYRMDECFSFLITYQDKRILVWSSTRTDGAEPADLLICRAVSGQRWYDRMMETVHPKVVIPSHWDDMFAPLSVPVKPFFSPPRLAWPPVKRIDLKEFERHVIKARAGCRVMVPERFREYEIEV